MKNKPNVRRKPSPNAFGLVYYTINRLASDSVHDLSGDDLAFIRHKSCGMFGGSAHLGM
jgi:hypothetical protein